MTNDLRVAEMVNYSSVACGIVAVPFVLLLNWKRKTPITLHKLLEKSFAASTIPTGGVLLLCAFNPRLIDKLDGMNMQIAAAGIAVLYISVKGLVDWEDKSSVDNSAASPETPMKPQD